jgi:hypothetical protein
MDENLDYIEKRKRIDEAIDILRQQLEAMDIAQKKDNKNFGFSGNCGKILTDIYELNEFLTNY